MQGTRALATVHAGEAWLVPTMVASVLRDLTHPPPPAPEVAKIARLTAREREVMTLIGAGLPNKAIAARLGGTEAAVRYHLTAIYAKVEIPDRLALALHAYQHGLAQPSCSAGTVRLLSR